ncbi:MAG TPA: endonuclease/exonuclease/phosphatase family protein [Allocoleopsis sp.]
MVKVVTINILFDLQDWAERRELLVQGLAAEQADLIALQEVKLPEDTSSWLAKQLDMPYVSLVPHHYPGQPGVPPHGLAILSRYPFIQQASLDLSGQGRRAHYVQIEIDHQPIVLCNGHYYWAPGPAPERVKQIQQVLEWLGALPPDLPIVAVGDFNGEPQNPAIVLMREHFTSAYAARHGHEPAYTCPTPLIRRGWRRIWKVILLNLKYNPTFRPWRGTLDYVFINRHLQVNDCRIILDSPSPGDPTLYPSDHFGLAAELRIV